LAEGKEKTGVDAGILAVNPVNQKEIPVWVADYVLGSYGTGAIMAVPAHDERDQEFAKKFGLPIKKVIEPQPILHFMRDAKTIAAGAQENLAVVTECWDGPGTLIHSDKFDGMESEEAKWEITKFAKGERKTNFRLRDWLISRQRYWGPPIPMI